MAHLHGDPDTIRDFARGLEQFTRETAERLGRLRVMLDRMSESTWTDKNATRFNEAFMEVYGRTQRLLEDIEPGHTSQLTHLAQRYEDLLS